MTYNVFGGTLNLIQLDNLAFQYWYMWPTYVAKLGFWMTTLVMKNLDWVYMTRSFHECNDNNTNNNSHSTALN